AVRTAVYTYMRARVKVQSFQMGPDGQQQHARQPQDRVIDGEFEEIDPDNPPQDGPSGWTKH
ncbi:MAG: FxsA family protein, partial [Octadecabacter sp.]